MHNSCVWLSERPLRRWESEQNRVDSLPSGFCSHSCLVRPWGGKVKLTNFRHWFLFVYIANATAAERNLLSFNTCCNCNFLEDLTILVLIFLIVIQSLASLICIWPPQIILKWSILRLLILQWRSWTWAAVTSGDPEASMKGPHRSLQSLWQLKCGGLISLPTLGTRTERNTLVLTLELNVQKHSEAEKRFHHQRPLSFSRPAQADAGSTKLATLVSVFIENRKKHFSSLNLQNKMYRS